MNCHQIEPKLHLYIRGELNNAERILLEKHLAECDECSKEYYQWLELEHLLNAMESPNLPPKFTDHVLRAINSIYPPKNKDKYWLTHYYRNIGKGLIAAGILALFINISAALTDFPIENSIAQGMNAVENFGNRYFEIYERVSLNLVNWKIEGGFNNEM